MVVEMKDRLITDGLLFKFFDKMFGAMTKQWQCSHSWPLHLFFQHRHQIDILELVLAKMTISKRLAQEAEMVVHSIRLVCSSAPELSLEALPA